MNNIFSRCFVCQKELKPTLSSRNLSVNLPVCEDCKGSEKEKERVSELLDGMADGFVCGCI